jgi:hypothetical protein
LPFLFANILRNIYSHLTNENLKMKQNLFGRIELIPQNPVTGKATFIQNSYLLFFENAFKV